MSRLTWDLATLSLHAGQQPDAQTGALAVPVHNSTAFVFDDAETAGELFDVARAGHLYSRISNPTVAAFEERIAALEGGVGAVATASGQAALHLTVATLLEAGDHIVASRALYGGSTTLLAHTMRRFGIETTFVDPGEPDSFTEALKERTRLFFAETIGNPRLPVLDVEAVAAQARSAGVPLVVDSTLATPCLARPIEHGADLVIHSATKFLGGHGVSLGGVVVDGGGFDWARGFAQMREPHPGYHGIRFGEQFGNLAFLMKARLEGLRDFGACLHPQAAFYLLQGLETLPLRMRKHCANALEIAHRLETHEQVEWVNYPGLETDSEYAAAQRYLPEGAGALVTFGVRGGRDAAAKLIESLELFTHVANLGDAKSLVIHPASTTHRQLAEEELESAGLTDNLIRLSVGLESIGDLVADLERALKIVARKFGGAQ
ncbi:MAG: O-acetylhomoserine aminocarboxypropyltransferase [Acidobacteriota bacterium]